MAFFRVWSSVTEAATAAEGGQSPAGGLVVSQRCVDDTYLVVWFHLGYSERRTEMASHPFQPATVLSTTSYIRFIVRLPTQ